jgi:hypothetical protein
MNLISLLFFKVLAWLFNHTVCKIGLITYSLDAGRMSATGLVLSTLLALSFL